MADHEDSAVEVEVDEEMQKMLGTTSFGKQTRLNGGRRDVEESRRPTAKSTAKVGLNGYEDSDEDEEGEKDTKDSNGDDDDDDDSEEEDDLPISHEMVLRSHDRAITTLSLSPSGARLITGSNDCTLKLHDFSSMTPTTIRAFKTVDPSASNKPGSASANTETHPVHTALFNPLSANHILVTTALPQAKILSRDGEILTEFVKGDMYLRDMKNTKGHISALTTGTWHPSQRNLCVTAGTDSTLRIWDIGHSRSQKEVIVHKSRAEGSAGRSRMSAVVWGAGGDGNLLLAAALDGSLTMWAGEGPYARPAAEIRSAHENNTWTSGLDISVDGRTVVSRGGDHTIKTWDTRKFKHPIATTSHASTSSQYPTENIRFSPDSNHILTGSATGHLHFLNPATLKPSLITPVTPGSPLTQVHWHAKLNQILTGSANGETHVLYSPTLSLAGGAKAVMSRAPKRRHIDDDPNLTTDIASGISSGEIIVPGSSGAGPSVTSHASRHPTIGLTVSGKSRDPRRPHVPAQTPFSKTNPDEEFVRKNIPLSSLRDEDPREALLKFAEKAKNDPVFTNAWAATQPKTVYAEFSDGEEEREEDGGPGKKKVKR
ncbi:hypothetical protein LTR86_002812 [Recurvomyces mirabilis]|nr:hypothetical protein LTR86_002812 [Recurvomyces mirabilis]